MERFLPKEKISKLNKDLRIVIAIALSSLVNINFFSSGTHGFVLALDVAVYSIILYMYKGSGIFRTTCIAAVVSPLSRMLTIYSVGTPLKEAANQVLPDASFFIIFGTIYWFMMRYAFKGEHDLANFIITIVLADFGGNMCELLLRTIINHQSAFSEDVIGFTIFAAAARTVLAYSVIALLEWYSENRLNTERLKEYRELLTKSAIIQDEIYIMNKNMAEVEAVMKKGYDLYRELDEEGYPSDKVGKILEIAKLTHEIKGDYRNVITVLSGLYDDELGEENLSIGEIIRIEQDNAMALIRSKGLDAEVVVRIEHDFEAEGRYRMMSVIRNLLTNAIEAIEEKGSEKPGRITVTVRSDEAEDGKKLGIIDVTDNGPGINPKRKEKLFKEGYSTKFDHKTGYIQRGLGLPVVKSYVENDMGGTIEILDDLDKGAHFRITVPAGKSAAEDNGAKGSNQ